MKYVRYDLLLLTKLSGTNCLQQNWKTNQVESKRSSNYYRIPSFCIQRKKFQPLIGHAVGVDLLSTDITAGRADKIFREPIVGITEF